MKTRNFFRRRLRSPLSEKRYYSFLSNPALPYLEVSSDGSIVT
jgi:hypothetical protein